jgi:hypothetical protein
MKENFLILSTDTLSMSPESKSPECVGKRGLFGYKGKLDREPWLPIAAQVSNTWQFELFKSFF